MMAAVDVVALLLRPAVVLEQALESRSLMLFTIWQNLPIKQDRQTLMVWHQIVFK